MNTEQESPKNGTLALVSLRLFSVGVTGTFTGHDTIRVAAENYGDAERLVLLKNPDMKIVEVIALPVIEVEALRLDGFWVLGDFAVQRYQVLNQETDQE